MSGKSAKSLGVEPKNQATKQTNVVAGETVKEKGKAGHALSGTAAKTKARKAYDMAKWRCSNDAGYQSVKFLLPSFAAFLEAVGPPKWKNYSLERINPNGHYELGNVKWANKSVQAANKKKSLGGSFSTLADYVKEAEAFKHGEACRAATAVAWMETVSYYNDVGSYRAVQEALKGAGLGNILTLNSFGPHHIYDYALAPGVFAMPSLNDPGRSICLTGGPFRDVADDGDERLAQKLVAASHRGIVRALGQVPPGANVAAKDAEIINRCLQLKAESGVCWHGMPYPEGLRVGWIEGMMLCVAATLSKSFCSAAVFPALHVIDLMPDQPWIDPLQGELGVHCLFIPDYQVDAGLGWVSKPRELATLTRLLTARCEAGLKTFIGVQNLRKMQADVRNTVLGYLRAEEFDVSNLPLKATIAEVRQRARETRLALMKEGKEVGPPYH